MTYLFDLAMYLGILSIYFGIGGAIVWAIMNIPPIKRRINKFISNLPMMNRDWYDRH